MLKVCLYIYCRAHSSLPSVKILAQDHFNDVVFNSFGVTFSILATKFLWWLDPVGAILIAIFILRSWSATAAEHIKLIAGKSAEPGFLNRIVYMSISHDPRILQIDTCKAYHSGYNVFVEVDIALPPGMRLDEAHNIGESLQLKLESMAEVDRAFVHLDYETNHRPEHARTPN